MLMILDLVELEFASISSHQHLKHKYIVIIISIMVYETIIVFNHIAYKQYITQYVPQYSFQSFPQQPQVFLHFIGYSYGLSDLLHNSYSSITLQNSSGMVSAQSNVFIIRKNYYIPPNYIINKTCEYF